MASKQPGKVIGAHSVYRSRCIESAQRVLCWSPTVLLSRLPAIGLLARHYRPFCRDTLACIWSHKILLHAGAGDLDRGGHEGALRQPILWRSAIAPLDGTSRIYLGSALSLLVLAGVHVSYAVQNEGRVGGLVLAVQCGWKAFVESSSRLWNRNSKRTMS